MNANCINPRILPELKPNQKTPELPILFDFFDNCDFLQTNTTYLQKFLFLNPKFKIFLIKLPKNCSTMRSINREKLMYRLVTH